MDLRAEGALRDAASAGLTLVRADNATGFRGVYHNERYSKPFKARLRRGGKLEILGCHATAEEAALAYARALGSEDSKARPLHELLSAWVRGCRSGCRSAWDEV